MQLVQDHVDPGSQSCYPELVIVLVGKDRRFHVGCIQDMMRESWRDDGIDQPMRGKQEDDTTNSTTCLSLEIKLPIDPEEERDADPLGSVAQKVADLITKNFRGSGNNPLATAMGDQATMMEVLGDSLGALTRGAGSGSSQLWKVTRVLWRLLLLQSAMPAALSGPQPRNHPCCGS